MYYRIVLVILCLCISVKSSQATESLNVWDLEMDFQYSEKVEENSHEDDLTMKLCNPTDQIITFRDDIRIGKPRYTVSYEIKGNTDQTTMSNASYVKLGESKSSFDFGIVNLKGGECKTYGFSSQSFFYGYYTRKIREARGIIMYENHKKGVKRDLSQDELDALRPKSFRVHVTIMKGDNIDAKAKGVTFRSDWYDINNHWLVPSFENKPLFQK